MVEKRKKLQKIKGNTKHDDNRKGIIDIGKKLCNAILFNKHVTTIRFKLVASFMVPIAFIIILGFVSFEKAAEGIRSSYEKSMGQALNMTSDYLLFGFDSVEGTATQYINDDNITKYFSGFYKDDVIENNNKQKEIDNLIKAKNLTDKFIGDIYFLSTGIPSITTKGNIGDDIYTGFLESDLGKYVAKNSRDAV